MEDLSKSNAVILTSLCVNIPCLSFFAFKCTSAISEFEAIMAEALFTREAYMHCCFFITITYCYTLTCIRIPNITSNTLAFPSTQLNEQVLCIRALSHTSSILVISFHGIRSRARIHIYTFLTFLLIVG